MIFVDTSFWFALRTPREGPRHERAKAQLPRHRADDLMTSDRVVEETWTLLRTRNGHRAAVDFARTLRESTTRVRLVRIDQKLADDAWAWLERHDERAYSFVDASSFAVLRQRGLHEALTFDDDFLAAGFAAPAL